MSCIKTGAHILIEPYNTYAHCDAFTHEGTFWFRIVALDAAPLSTVLNFTLRNWITWYDERNTSPSTPSTMLCRAADVINHGWAGILLRSPQ